MHNAVSLFRARSVAAAVRGCPAKTGIYAPGAATDSLSAKGLTNEEIANHFCLSEQTVKDHLYRIKHKVGAEDRLSLVERYRTQGFLL
jgi:hypothetical protein